MNWRSLVARGSVRLAGATAAILAFFSVVLGYDVRLLHTLTALMFAAIALVGAALALAIARRVHRLLVVPVVSHRGGP